MAVSQGAGTLCFVLLLCCWQELCGTWPRTMTPGSSSGPPSSSSSFKNIDDDMATVFDEILVQEILDQSKTTSTEMPSTASTLLTAIHAGTDENYQVDGSENYHELLQNLPFSSGTEDKISNDEASANANLRGAHSENYYGPGSEKRVSSKEEKNSKNTQYNNLSVLDKILQNMGRSSGNDFRKEQPKTSAQSRRPGSQ
ncbi:sperm acrosome-associated protein 7 [Callithrix jacchus]|uniref:Sperm acrosome associated 7 n=1 Tax=Callithrix jacchus TaxID=9483 RepID=A0A8I3W4K2_CALJA|nr:sperm acrosome-associated protein 7 [Callithrix jacchus]